MARPSKSNPPDQFTVPELALGAGLSVRNCAYVLDRRLGPEPSKQIVGRAGHRLFDSDGLAHFALIGAIHRGGAELLLSARLADAVASELGAAYGDLRSNLDRYLEAPLNPRAPNYPWSSGPAAGIAGDTRDDFWLHHQLRIGAPAYRPGQALHGDFVLHLVDRTYVYLDVATASGVADAKPEPLYRILNWGPKAEVRPYYLDGPALDRRDAEARAAQRQLLNEFAQAWDNATARLRINISLAIRNALDAVFDQRDQRLERFDWTATARPEPGRYAGCDLDGYPLDPEHPWNRDLPPERRAARLAEIEAYIDARDAEQGPG